MKPVIVLMILAAVAGCSSTRPKPYQPSDTTASGGAASSQQGPTQRSTQRMFNPDGSLGTYFGT